MGCDDGVGPCPVFSSCRSGVVVGQGVSVPAPNTTTTGRGSTVVATAHEIGPKGSPELVRQGVVQDGVDGTEILGGIYYWEGQLYF